MLKPGYIVPLLSLLLLPLFSDGAQASTRGSLAIETRKGEQVGLYTGSYALLIGVSDYTEGWPKLEQVPGELARVEQVLKRQGFQVETILDPDSEDLEDGIQDFIDHYGYAKGNRLLIFYSGHGHTMNNGRRGYLVPVDAPDPRDHPVNFKRRALDMNQILAWCRQMDAKHALFLFDSCFSGTIFKQKDLPQQPAHITRLTSRPVRQFITAGSAGEPVPARSTFTPAFVDAIEHGLADLNKDSYVSGTELGLYLQNLVPDYSRQSPQYGKIRDYELSRGDFIFLAGGGSPPPSQPETGSLMVRTEPEGAVVYVNGKRQGAAPVKVSGLKADTYQVEARKEGYVAVSRPVRVQSRKIAEAILWLESASQVGKLYVNPTPSDARVRIMNIVPKYEDGIELSPGEYHIRIDRRGYATEERWVKLSDGEEMDISVELEKISTHTPSEIMAKSIYSENFSTNPNWEIVNERFHAGEIIKWNSQNGYFKVKTYDNSNGRITYKKHGISPIFEIIDGSRDFLISFDLMPVSTSWGHIPWFEMSYNGKRIIGIRYDWRNNNCFRIVGLGIPMSTSTPKENQWYNFKLFYHNSKNILDVKISRGNRIFFEKKGIFYNHIRFNQLRFHGDTRNGEGKWCEMYLDNINIKAY